MARATTRQRGPTSARVAASMAVAALVAAACSSASEGDDVVVVFAAASLTDVMAELETSFEALDDADVEVSIAGSSALVVQIEEGAPADVAAFADTSVMDRLVGGGLVDEPVVFATNALVIAVPRENRAGVTDLSDFERADLLLGACAAQVPCGAYAAEVFDAAGVEPTLDTEEPDVRSLAAKITAGELDAGIVYATDVAASNGELVAVDLPVGVEVAALYPIGAVVGGGNAERAAAAQRFVDFVVGPDGVAIMADAGFGAP